MMRKRPQQSQKTGLLKDEPGFSLFVELFNRMNKERDLENLEAVGGVRELALAIGVDVNVGIDTTPQDRELFSMKDREEVFGKNVTSSWRPQRSFSWTRGILRHHYLTPLILLAIINTILGSSFEGERENLGWIDDAGIWIFVLIIVSAGLALDYLQFRSRQVINARKDIFDVRVVRDGQEQLIKNSELLVGDILVLRKDVTVAADGLLFVDNQIFVNEEAVSGDSKPVKKTLSEDPFCRSGTHVTNGSGRILVTAVGNDSEIGKIIKKVTDSTDYTDDWMREIRVIFFWFNIAALCLGVLSFIVLLIRWMVGKKGFPVDEISKKGPVQLLILAIIIIVVELPNGFLLFPLFGYIYIGWKHSKDNIIFRNANVSSWFLNVNSICFDKTGTLTENKMTVEEGWFHGKYFDHLPNIEEELDPTTMELMIENASLNSEAFLNIEEDGSVKFVGNRTECALLVMIKKFGVDYSEVRLQKGPHVIKNYGFNSNRKMSTIVLEQGHLLRLYNKGAAEMVLEKCTEYVDQSGSINSISEFKRMELESIIKTMASQGLRTLALTYVDLKSIDFNFNENGEPLDHSIEGKKGFAEAPEEHLVLLAIVGIKDPIREGVSEVVEQLTKAEIKVRMITGDSLDTAKQVARECGILTFEGLAMEGAQFRQRIDEDIEGIKKDLPQLQVLARASPSDKQIFVKLLKSTGEKVAVAGDGTNDARALKESHIGIAMGTNSTEVAREAADVVVLNDDISSVLKLYLRARCYWLNMTGHWQFRSPVSFVVWIVVLVSVCAGGETPFNAHQFLWAKFIIDCMVALTFATESPPKRVPDGESYRARRDVFNKDSYVLHYNFQSYYQIFVIICTFYCLSSLFERYEVPAKDEFYYHYCYDDLSGDKEYLGAPVQSYCVQYLNCSQIARNCTLLEQQALDEVGSYHDFRDHIIDEYEVEHDAAKMRKNSLMFNIFIFMQLFNSLNYRKIFDEYNIFEGLFNSPLSCAIRLVTIALQLMITLTPVRTLFKVTELNAWEWLYSVGVSFVVIALSAFIRFDAKTKIIDLESICQSESDKYYIALRRVLQWRKRRTNEDVESPLY